MGCAMHGEERERGREGTNPPPPPLSTKVQKRSAKQGGDGKRRDAISPLPPVCSNRSILRGGRGAWGFKEQLKVVPSIPTLTNPQWIDSLLGGFIRKGVNYGGEEKRLHNSGQQQHTPKKKATSTLIFGRGEKEGRIARFGKGGVPFFHCPLSRAPPPPTQAQ